MDEATYGQSGAMDNGEPRSPSPTNGAPVGMLSLGAGGSVGEPASVLPPAYFKGQLLEAELLVQYAAEAGIDVGDELRREVLAAKIAVDSGWTEVTGGRLLAALTKLTVLLKPVSGESLRKCAIGKEASSTIRTYRTVATTLGVIIVPFSVAAFMASATCETIRKDIEVANALAVTLGQKISPAFAAPQAAENGPTDEVRPHGEGDLKELQQFASTIRDIRARAKWLRSFGINQVSEQDPVRFELPVPISNFEVATADAIRSYQRVRYFAQSVQETVSTTLGALTTCILPVSYAVLGACAYLTRVFESQIKARTFTGIERPTAHFLVAAISGFVVGLFGAFGTGQGAVLPPLALAFLVGYGVDVFFQFLDRLLQTFGRQRADPTSAK